MNSLFALQLVASFLAGGLFIALLSLLAERLPKEAAGIVVTLPSTFVIALIFLSISHGNSVIRDMAPAIPLPLGASYIFVVVYVLLSQKIHTSKSASVLLCSLGGMAAWFAISLPIVIFEYSDLLVSTIGFFLLIGLCHYILAVKLTPDCKPVSVKFTPSELLVRCIVAGGIIATIVALAKFMGPIWGGLFSVFPAALLSTLTLIHYNRGASLLPHVTASMPAGAPVFLVYVFVAYYTYPAFGIIIGTIVSYTISVVYAYLAHKLLVRVGN